jgi:hypothetical protein
VTLRNSVGEALGISSCLVPMCSLTSAEWRVLCRGCVVSRSEKEEESNTNHVSDGFGSRRGYCRAMCCYQDGLDDLDRYWVRFVVGTQLTLESEV